MRPFTLLTPVGLDGEARQTLGTGVGLVLPVHWKRQDAYSRLD